MLGAGYRFNRYWVLIIAVVIGAYWKLGPVPDPAASHIEVITHAPFVTRYLQKYRAVLAGDYDAYVNHNLRVLTYALDFLHGDDSQRHIIEAALAYHDLGLWADNITLDYLEPSWQRAEAELAAQFTVAELELVRNIILYHHKVTPFVGPMADVVNAVRKADWVDASVCLVRHGMTRDDCAKVNQVLPNEGFHAAILRAGARVHGVNVPKIVWEFAHIFKV
mmetsp:Transcript_9211/g.26785  ORF Transcript_9211/g.26785 Transcript_9211/m.26785 type:complete len:221 (-) Transcript_9211:492-1154(-)